MIDEDRSRQARSAAESALVRVVHHYGATPEFVLIGGLVPEILCSRSGIIHAGTSDVDVQVNLEIAQGSVQVRNLEQALLNAEFQATSEHVWRWKGATGSGMAEVKFELLADLENERAEAIIEFDNCDNLGAVNLPGTGYAVRDFEALPIKAKIGGVLYEVTVNVTGVAGFVLAKVAAAYGRRKEKDWYDLAFVLLHNDAGGPQEAARRVNTVFGSVDAGVRSMLVDLKGNFTGPDSQGVNAYVEQMLVDHPDASASELAADAELAVGSFVASIE